MTIAGINRHGSYVAMKKLIAKVGDVVAFNTLPDAAWFDVLEIKGFLMLVREHGTEHKEQTIDKGSVRQIKPRGDDEMWFVRNRLATRPQRD